MDSLEARLERLDVLMGAIVQMLGVADEVLRHLLGDDSRIVLTLFDPIYEALAELETPGLLNDLSEGAA